MTIADARPGGMTAAEIAPAGRAGAAGRPPTG